MQSDSQTRHLMLMLLHELGDSIESRSKFRDMMYFLGIHLGKNFEYRSEYYGPDSQQIASAMGDLRGAGYTISTTIDNPKRGIHGFKERLHSIELTECGISFAKSVAKNETADYAAICRFVSIIRVQKGFDYLPWALASKAHFDLEVFITEGDVRERAWEYDWRTRDADVTSAIDILRILSLLEDDQ